MNRPRKNSPAIYDRRLPDARAWPVPDSVRTRHASRVRQVVISESPNHQYRLYKAAADPEYAYKVLGREPRSKFLIKTAFRLEAYQENPYSLKAFKQLTRATRRHIRYDKIDRGQLEAQIYWEREQIRSANADGYSLLHGISQFFKIDTDDLLEYFARSEIFYRNVLWHWAVGFALYFQDYVFVQLALHYPILDWLADWSPFFMWEFQVELHLWRIFVVLIVLFFFVFSISHYLLGYGNKFERRISTFHFTTIFGSIFFYHFTGLAPFIFFTFFSLVTCVYYNFYYYLPAAILRNFRPPPILCLPAPKSSPKNAVLSTFRRYSSYFSTLPTVVTSAPLVDRRSAIPFPFINIVRLRRNSYQISPGSYFPTELQTAFKNNSPLFLGDWSKNSDNFAPSPLENLRVLDLLNSTDPDALYTLTMLPLRYHATLQYDLNFGNNQPLGYGAFPIESGFFPGLAKEPVGLSNSTLFGITSRSFSRSILKNFFTGEISHDPISDLSNPIFWHSSLLNNSQFRLYTWLRRIAPYYHAEPLRSRELENFISLEAYSAPSRVYGFFESILVFFYDGLLSRLFNAVTLGTKFSTSIPTPSTAYTSLSSLIKLTGIFDRVFFIPNLSLCHILARFSRLFYTWVYKDLFSDPDCSKLRSDVIFRNEVIHFLSSLLCSVNRFAHPSSSYFAYIFPRSSRFLYFAALDFHLSLELLVSIDPDIPEERVEEDDLD